MATYEITYVRRLVSDAPPTCRIDCSEKAVDYFRENCFGPA